MNNHAMQIKLVLQNAFESVKLRTESIEIVYPICLYLILKMTYAQSTKSLVKK